MRIIQKSLPSHYSADEQAAIARYTLMHYTGTTFTELMLRSKDTLLSPEQVCAINLSIDRLSRGEPLQYVLGSVEFGPLHLSVAPGVLIPRPETEELCRIVVDNLLGSSPRPLPQSRVVDVGTGSGCIALYLAYYLRECQVLAMEREEEALTIAQQNFDHFRSSHALSSPALYQDDLFVASEEFHEQWKDLDVIVSNPPYIPVLEKKGMEAHVLDYEPHTALFVPDNAPLLYYEALLKFALRYASSLGIAIFCETHYLYAQEVALLFSSSPCIQHVKVHRDFLGKERFVSAFSYKDVRH